jgi:hypothetical protein
MTTRVDPRQYSDTPIFQALLEERNGRWPGITPEDPGASLYLPMPPENPSYPVRAMYPVPPIQDRPERPVRPYVATKEFLAYDPEETHSMSLPPAAEG